MVIYFTLFRVSLKRAKWVGKNGANIQHKGFSDGAAKLDSKLSKNVQDIINFIMEAMKNWKVELTGVKTLAAVKI